MLGRPFGADQRAFPQADIAAGFDNDAAGFAAAARIGFDRPGINHVVFGKNADFAVFESKRRVNVKTAGINDVGSLRRFEVGQNLAGIDHAAGPDRNRIKRFDFAFDGNDAGRIDRQVARQHGLGRQLGNAAVLPNHLIHEFLVRG